MPPVPYSPTTAMLDKPLHVHNPDQYPSSTCSLTCRADMLHLPVDPLPRAARNLADVLDICSVDPELQASTLAVMCTSIESELIHAVTAIRTCMI